MNTFISQELRFAALGDTRLNHRLERLVTALADKPAASVPHALGDWSQTKAAYRFWDNERIAPGALRDAHRQATAARLPEAGVVLAVQDTTPLSFTGHKAVQGLGYLTQRHQRGLLVHSLTAVTDDGVPRGVLHQQESAAAVWDATQPEVLLGCFRLPTNGSPTWREAVRWAARLGGFLNRRGDGAPGVKCLWRGWNELQAMVTG